MNMKYNSYFRVQDKKYHKNSREKDNLNATYNHSSISKNNNGQEYSPNPNRLITENNQRMSKDKFIPRIPTDHNQFLNTQNRKSYGSKTPKSSHSWLIRQNVKKLELEKAIRSKSKLDEKKQKLQKSMTPKAFENIYSVAEQAYHSSKAKDNIRYQSFNKKNDFKNSAEQKNKGYIKQSLKIQTQYQVKSISPAHRRNFRDNQQKQIKNKNVSQEDIKVSKGKKLDVEKNQQLNRKKQQKQNYNDSYNCQFQLTQEELKNFGDRFPSNFVKVALLGRGGFSLVWLGIQKKTKKKMAIKQILTKNPHQTHLKQIWFGSYYFHLGGQPRQQFIDHPGINNICRLLAYDIKPQDTWLFYEICQQSLGNSLYQLKGETINDERQYKIIYKSFYQKLRQDSNQLRFLIIQLAKALMLMNTHNIVHSDLKTQNILLKFKRKQECNDDSISLSKYIKCVKIIDFGSSFLFTNLKQFSMATPQYMPPEILNYILFQNQLQYDQKLLLKIEKYKNPWIVDIWSLGCIILQIISGVPLWMSLKTKIEYQGENTYASGLFAVKGRLFPKIISKQIEAIKKIDYHLDHENYSGIIVPKDIRSVLKKMLSLEPEERISPREVLKHFNIECQPDRFPFY